MVMHLVKILVVVLALGGVFYFREPIMEYYGLKQEDVAAVAKIADVVVPNNPNKTEAAAPALEMPKWLPEEIVLKQQASIFRDMNGTPFATVSAGQPVSILDEEDKGQAFIAVRHNGMAGYIARRDLNLN